MTDQSVILRVAGARHDPEARTAATRPGPGSKQRRARPERRSERRAAILSAALEEFAARGFAATRLEDIAGRAGVAKGTIYLYFRDKESFVPGARAVDVEPARGALSKRRRCAICPFAPWSR